MIILIENVIKENIKVLKRAYKTEIKLAKKQIQKINQSISICR
ncbi:MAG: helix-turn-helix domain-containing protein [Clostridium sp.]|nr:helix-turn-helix domain-containing protein [Clostridium sp.]